MTQQDEEKFAKFARQLVEQCKDHDGWLAIMRFGLGTLLDNQPLLLECLTREAQRECAHYNLPDKTPTDYIRLYFRELKLEFKIAG